MINITKDDYIIFSFIFVTLIISIIFKIFPDNTIQEKFEIFPGYSLAKSPVLESGLNNYDCIRKKGKGKKNQ